MGAGRVETGRLAAVAALGVAAVGAGGSAPVGAVVLLVGLGVVGLVWPPAGVLAAVVAWTWGVNGPLGPAVVGVAVVGLGVAGARPGEGRVGLGIAALAVVEALRQQGAARVLPAAVVPVPELVIGGMVAGGAFAMAARPSAVGGRVLAVGALIAAGVAMEAPPAWTWPSRVSGLLPGDERARLALVREAPDEDAAALVGEGEAADRRALDAGWRPWRACPSDRPRVRLSWWPRSDLGVACVDGGARAVRVAAALDQRGRGGEALRLLGRHPRLGRVDWEMALYEVRQGAPTRWRGFVAPGADSLPGRLDWPLELLGNRESTREVVAAWALTTVTVEGVGQAYEGAPSLGVLLDGREVGRCAMDGPTTCTLPVPIAAGPHRVRLLFDTDRTGAAGDRNVTVIAVSAG